MPARLRARPGRGLPACQSLRHPVIGGPLERSSEGRSDWRLTAPPDGRNQCGHKMQLAFLPLQCLRAGLTSKRSFSSVGLLIPRSQMTGRRLRRHQRRRSARPSSRRCQPQLPALLAYDAKSSWQGSKQMHSVLRTKKCSPIYHNKYVLTFNKYCTAPPAVHECRGSSPECHIASLTDRQLSKSLPTH